MDGLTQCSLAVLADTPHNRAMTLKHSDRLRDEIEERIALGLLPPGHHLDETELAEAFGVSRTPVREALQQLASAGLIELRPRRGAQVRRLEPMELVQMFEVMAELEGMCGRLASRRLTAEAEARLLASHEACREVVLQQGSPDVYYELNDQFHITIYQSSGNAFLVEQALALRRRLRPYRRLQLRVRGRVPTSFREHEQIVEAIRQGREEEANQLLRTHVLIQGERFADLMASLPLLNSV